MLRKCWDQFFLLGCFGGITVSWKIRHFTSLHPILPSAGACVAHTHGGAPTTPLLWSQGTQVRPSRGEWGFLMGTQPARWTYLRDVGGFNGNTIGIEWKTPFFFPPFWGLVIPNFRQQRLRGIQTRGRKTGFREVLAIWLTVPKNHLIPV